MTHAYEDGAHGAEHPQAGPSTLLYTFYCPHTYPSCSASLQLMFKGYEEARVAMSTLLFVMPCCIIIGVQYGVFMGGKLKQEVLDLDVLNSYEDQLYAAVCFSTINALEKLLRMSLVRGGWRCGWRLGLGMYTQQQLGLVQGLSMVVGLQQRSKMGVRMSLVRGRWVALQFIVWLCPHSLLACGLVIGGHAHGLQHSSKVRLGQSGTAPHSHPSILFLEHQSLNPPSTTHSPLAARA